MVSRKRLFDSEWYVFIPFFLKQRFYCFNKRKLTHICSSAKSQLGKEPGIFERSTKP
jgi:hypothetical protein